VTEIAITASTTIVAIATGIAIKEVAAEPTMAIATTSTTRTEAAVAEEVPPTTEIEMIRVGTTIATGIAMTDSMGAISCWVARSWHRGSNAT